MLKIPKPLVMLGLLVVTVLISCPHMGCYTAFRRPSQVVIDNVESKEEVRLPVRDNGELKEEVRLPVREYLTDAQVAGELAAKRNVDANAWLIAGFVFPGPSIIVASGLTPTPPVSEMALLADRHSDYTAAYMSGYKRAGKNMRLKSALMGSFFSVITLVVLTIASG